MFWNHYDKETNDFINIINDSLKNRPLESKIAMSMYIVFYSKISIEIIPYIEKTKLSMELSSVETEKIINTFIQLPILFTVFHNNENIINKSFAEKVKTSLIMLLNYKNKEAYNQLKILIDSYDNFNDILLKITIILIELDHELSVSNSFISIPRELNLFEFTKKTIEILYSCDEKKMAQKIFELVGYSNFSDIQQLLFMGNFINGKF